MKISVTFAKPQNFSATQIARVRQTLAANPPHAHGRPSPLVYVDDGALRGDWCGLAFTGYDYGAQSWVRAVATPDAPAIGTGPLEPEQEMRA